MIESIMYFGIGFLVAALSVLVALPLVHGRAVRLTTRRVERAIPSSLEEIQAEKDLLRAECAMSTRRLEMNVEQLKTKSASQLAELGRKGDLINRLKIELCTLRDQLCATGEEFAVKATAMHEAERALFDKESELAKLMGELEKRSTLVDAQKIEITALKTEVAALKEGLDRASNEMKTMENRRDAERVQLKEATRKLTKERGKFEDFHCRVAELVEQLVAQTTEDKIRVQDLENRVVEQSRLLNQSALELKHMRGEIEIARKTEADLRSANSEIEDRSNAATQNIKGETEKLQAVLDRANDERVRLTHELAILRQQAEKTWAA